MKKIYAFFFVIVYLPLANNVLSQTRKDKGFSHSNFVVIKPVAGPTLHSPGCDTINYPIPNGWSVTYFTFEGGGGYLSGNNKFNDLQKANFFDVSSSSNTYLTQVWIGFGKANGPDLTKVIPIRVLDGSTNVPGNSLGSVNLILGDIRTDVLAADYTEVVFNPAIVLPASKKFFISVDISNLTWVAPKDSLAVFTSDFDEPANNLAWEQWEDGTWNDFEDVYGGTSSLIIHPFVSTNANCSIITPVTMSGFSAAGFGAFNRLSWETITETNSGGFETERSSDGIHFEKLQYVPSKASHGNSSASIQYSCIDKNPFAANNFYRLKQLDNNGRGSYSSIVLVNRSKVVTTGIISLFPNPAKNILNLVLSSSVKGLSTVSVTNVAGVTVFQKNIQTTAGVNQNVELKISVLPPGTYFVSVTGEKNREKFVKGN